MLEKIKNTTSFLQTNYLKDFTPKVGIILGTGLGGLATKIEKFVEIKYSEIPNFPQSTVAGHSGKLVFGKLGGVNVVAMQGRFHYYEGYTTQEVTFPVRVMKLLGINYLFVSNASGGVNQTFSAGDIMIINDHINLIPNPLIGKNMDEFGVRFPEMSEPYSHELISLAEKCAKELNIDVKKGVYTALSGPSLETNAEYRFIRTIGGDAVGMSTVPEVIVARHMQLPVFGISVITNIGGSGKKDSHEENCRVGQSAEERLSKLIINMLEQL
jgi:purine-nucleoside phosphorylase